MWYTVYEPVCIGREGGYCCLDRQSIKGERYETNHKIKRSDAAVSQLADFFDNPFDLHEFKYTDGR